MNANNGAWVCSLAKVCVHGPLLRDLCFDRAAVVQNVCEFHLSPKVLFGVHVGRGGKGVIEEDESVSLHVEGQVRTRGEDVILSLPRFERAIVSHTEETQPWDIQGKKDRTYEDVTQTAAKDEHYIKIYVKYMGMELIFPTEFTDLGV